MVFDKTGTLTERFARVTEVMVAAGSNRDEVMALAAAVEAESDHPIASAIRDAAGLTAAGLTVAGMIAARAEDVVSVPGVGVEGTVGGERIRVLRRGRSAVPAELAAGVAGCEARGETVVVVERNGAVVGAIAVTTPMRPEAEGRSPTCRPWG